MQKAFDRIKLEFERNPLQVILIGAFAAAAAAKLIDASANAASRRTWAREVDRRDRMSRR